MPSPVRRRSKGQAIRPKKSRNEALVSEVIEQLQPTITQAVQDALQAALPHRAAPPVAMTQDPDTSAQ